MTTLSELEDAVDRHGRAVLTNPVALADVLRDLPADEREALVAASEAGVPQRLREKLAEGATAEEARREALAALAGVEPVRAEWAVDQLGRALGFLPREPPETTTKIDRPEPASAAVPPPVAPDDSETQAPTTPSEPNPAATTAPPGAGREMAAGGAPVGAAGVVPGGGAPVSGGREVAAGGAPVGGAGVVPGGSAPVSVLAGGRRVPGGTTWPWVVGALVAAAVVLAGLLVFLPPGRTSGVALPVPDSAGASGLPTAPGGLPSPTGATTTAPVTAADAFKDAQLLAAAKPYLGRQDARCQNDPDVQLGVQESVGCDLGGGFLAIFRKLLGTDQLTTLRQVLVTDNSGAAPGTVRQLRWEYVAGKPGVRAGIPVGTPRTGDGTRIRFQAPGTGFARLYFDEDKTGVAVYMQATGSDQQLLRAYWADPDS